MSTKTPSKKTAPAKASSGTQDRQPITFELAQTLAPTATHAEKMSAAFALDPVDYHGIRESTEEMVGRTAQLLALNDNEVAVRIHLQRVVGAFVSSAHGAAGYYQGRVTQARDLTSKLANEHRDEDRDGVYGFETKADRAREYAAKAGLTAFALLAAAEGARDAYAAVTGEEWKPYTGNQPTVRQRSIAAEMDALG